MNSGGADFIRELALRVPELSEVCHSGLAQWDDDDYSASFLFDMIVCPFIENELVGLLGDDNHELPEFLARLYAFFEDVAESRDESVANIARSSIAPCLRSNRELLEKTRLLLGPRMAYLTRDYISRYPRSVRKRKGKRYYD